MGCGNSKTIEKTLEENSSKNSNKPTNNLEPEKQKKQLRSVRSLKKVKTLRKIDTIIDDVYLEVSYKKQRTLIEQTGTKFSGEFGVENTANRKVKIKQTKLEGEKYFTSNLEDNPIDILLRQQQQQSNNNIDVTRDRGDSVLNTNPGENFDSSNPRTKENTKTKFLANNSSNGRLSLMQGKKTPLKATQNTNAELKENNTNDNKSTLLVNTVNTNNPNNSENKSSSIINNNMKILTTNLQKNTEKSNNNINNHTNNKQSSRGEGSKITTRIEIKPPEISQDALEHLHPQSNIVTPNSISMSNKPLFGTNFQINSITKKLDLKAIILKRKNKNMSILDNMEIKSLNHSAMRIKKYFLNQQPVLPSSSSNSKKFIDPLFPPNINSMLGKDASGKVIDKCSSRYAKNLKKLVLNIEDIFWLRPEDIFPGGKYTIFEGSIDIDDVNQGSLGNCYFLSAIAALCEYPQMVSEIFRQFKVNENGYYEVVFNLNGIWKVVIIDDFFPCLKSNKCPIFCKPKNSELWVLILEKAWAKVNGGYANIIGGWPCEVLSAVTPFCLKSYNNKDYKNELFNIILDADQKGFIMACSSIFEPSIERKGLISGHAFTIISAHEGNIRGKEVKLLRIRNPWGYQEWNGPWSDGSPEWDVDAKKAFGEFVNQDDGTFFIEYSDYIANFLETQICRVLTPSCTKSIVIQKERLFCGNIYEMLINRISILDISVIRKSFRFHRAIPDDTEITINILLFKKEGSSLEILRIEGDNDHDPVLEINLDPGTYIIYILCNKESYKMDRERTLRLYIVCNNYYLINDKGIDKNFALLSEAVSQKCSQLQVEKSLIALTKNKIAERSTIGVFYLKNCSGNAKRFKINCEIMNFTILNDFRKFNNATESEEEENMINSINNLALTKKLSKKITKQDNNINLSTLRTSFKTKQSLVSPRRNFDIKNTMLSTKKSGVIQDKELRGTSIGNVQQSTSMVETLNLRSRHSKTKSFDNGIGSFLVKLESEEDFLLIGLRKYYYDEYWFNVSFEEPCEDELTSMKYLELFKDKSTLSAVFFNNLLDEEFLIRPDLDSYDYFFKRHDIDVNQELAVTIDDMNISLEYFSVKYPQFMSILLKLKPLANTPVKFMDIFDSGVGVYFGEWKVASKTNSVPMKHGRGLTIFEDGSKHVGYYENDEYNGEGQFIYKDGSKLRIKFEDGKMHGEGVQVKNGVEKKCLYEDGCFSRWL